MPPRGATSAPQGNEAGAMRSRTRPRPAEDPEDLEARDDEEARRKKRRTEYKEVMLEERARQLQHEQVMTQLVESTGMHTRLLKSLMDQDNTRQTMQLLGTQLDLARPRPTAPTPQGVPVNDARPAANEPPSIDDEPAMIEKFFDWMKRRTRSIATKERIDKAFWIIEQQMYTILDMRHMREHKSAQYEQAIQLGLPLGLAMRFGQELDAFERHTGTKLPR